MLMQAVGSAIPARRYRIKRIRRTVSRTDTATPGRSALAAGGRDACRAATVRRMSELEAVLAALSIFEHLRPDEVARIARRFQRVELAAGERHGGSDQARLVVVVRGEVDVDVDEGRTHHLHARMTALRSIRHVLAAHRLCEAVLRPGARPSNDRDHRARGVRRSARGVPRDRAARRTRAGRRARRTRRFLAPVARAPRREPAGDRAPGRDRGTALGAAEARRARHANVDTLGMFRRLVVQQGAEPPFWMLVGFIASLSGARLVVHLILKYKLESQLFKLGIRWRSEPDAHPSLPLRSCS